MRRSYWEYKEPIVDLERMERGESADQEGARMSRHVFSAQWMQNPTALGGNIIKGAWFPRYKILPKLKYRKIFVDTAQKIKKRNDFSVFECYGFGEDGRLYLLDLLRGKWEGPDLRKNGLAFWAKHHVTGKEVPHLWYEPPPGVDSWAGNLREMKVEDKSSGTDLIQSLKLVNSIPIKPIERNIDKLTRAMDAQPYLEAGLVCIPEAAPFTSDFIAEAEAFTADDTHAFDDQLDPLFDAVQDLLSSQNKLAVWSKLI